MAKALEYVFVDTGAMYRAIALYFLRNSIPFNDIAAQEALQAIELRFKYNSASQKSDMFLNGENVEQEIRAMQVSQKVSEVATIPAVRAFAVAQQKAMGVDKGIVMDGRDIGTVVFPNAELKLFVTADPAIRLERRYQELVQTNPAILKEEVAENLQQRDLMDSTRTHSPLKQAEDAMVLDNTNLDRAQQFELAMQWAMEKIKSS
jgi:cytidylate kinase